MLLAQETDINMRPSQTFQKRQKELARQEKQRAKAQRKLQRKLEQPAPADDFSAHNALADSTSLTTAALQSAPDCTQDSTNLPSPLTETRN
jgi:hypothetical protein